MKIIYLKVMNIPTTTTTFALIRITIIIIVSNSLISKHIN